MRSKAYFYAALRKRLATGPSIVSFGGWVCLAPSRLAKF